MGSTAGETVKNQIKAIQDKVLPTTPKPAVTEPQKTITEIEAETLAQRDRARSMGMNLESYRKEFPGPVSPMGPQPSPDYQKYKELNQPQSFKSFEDVLTNWAKRDAFKRTGEIPNIEVVGSRVNQTSNPQINQQSFTQQEAAFSNNTSALTSLTGGIENLNSTLSNFEANFGNLNNVPGTQPAGAQAQAGAQPGATTTTNAPVSVIVNAQGSNDIAAAVGQAVQNAIPAIIDKVKVALGQKVPPTAPNMNIK
jgi:hypothetical protein